MHVISTIIEYQGWPIKIENGRVYGRSFGTTLYNKSIHWGWMEIKPCHMTREFKEFLNQTNLIAL